MMLTRNLVYTAVTRAERVCVLVAQPGALAGALGRRDARRRHTRLARLVREQGALSGGAPPRGGPAFGNGPEAVAAIASWRYSDRAIERDHPVGTEAGALGTGHGVSMIWAVTLLALIGVPLRRSARASSRSRSATAVANPVGQRRCPRSTCGQAALEPALAVEVSDVLAYRGAPAAWKE